MPFGLVAEYLLAEPGVEPRTSWWESVALPTYVATPSPALLLCTLTILENVKRKNLAIILLKCKPNFYEASYHLYLRRPEKSLLTLRCVFPEEELRLSIYGS